MIDALYRSFLRPSLFAVDPESAHSLAAGPLGWLHRNPRLASSVRARLAPPRDPRLAVDCFGTTLANPFGIAAGFDKACSLFNGLGALGWASVEVGTLTARPQEGNPRPRLFRLPADHALINRMGFNNPGSEAAARALDGVSHDGLLLGINLGKSKVTALEEAPADYAESAARVGRFADYVVVNVSSPNTPGLRSLQSVEALGPIVEAVQKALGEKGPPLLVKIAPDLADEDIDAVVDHARSARLAGIIATNTTLSRDGLATPAAKVEAAGQGGLSGRPLKARSTAVIKRIRRRAGAELVVIGVGGIETSDDAWAKLEAGANWVQVYSGFVYAGPTMVRGLCEGLLARMAREGVARIADLTARGSEG